MANENWNKAKRIFADAMKVAPAKRSAFLDEVCKGDAETRREVESLLASLDDAGSFMEQPAAHEVSGFIRQNKSLEASVRFGHYEIIRQIGAGGMGEVFLAEDTKLNRQVALKILPDELANDTERMRRFVQEAKVASALNHPNIITIYEIGANADTHFIAAEYIEGETLHNRLKSEPRQLKFALDAGVQIASALQAAHSAGIVHRDIKPENIIIRPDGLVKILDFGIAKLIEKKPESVDTKEATAIKPGTSPGMIIGTANYMSPEQAAGRAVDTRSDVFSFGIVLYEMITNKQPFEGETAIDVINSILNKEPAPLNQFFADIPPEIERIVGKTLKKDREERYQTVKDLLIDLKNARQESEIQNRLERSEAPHREKAETQTFNQTTADVRHTTSSAEYLIGEIKSRKRGFTVGLLVLMFASIGLGYWFFVNRSASADIESIAVLPFENASGDADLDYLSDGLSESLIDRLSGLPQMKVIARNSSFKHRGNADLAQVANALGAQAIITGRVARRGDDLIIRVEMIDTRDNRQLWSENFTRSLSDAQKLQTDISREITENLHLRLSGAQTRQFTGQETTNPQAYELLLKGRFHWRKGGTENYKKAFEYYEQAIAVDPNYALAYAELSVAYSLLAANGALNSKEFIPKAEAAARKALELDENLANAHLAIAILNQTAWDWAAAEAAYKRAVELNPNLADVRRRYSFFLSVIGRHDEAISEAKRDRELDPLSLRASLSVASAFFYARRFDEAIAESEKMLELDKKYIPAYATLGLSYAAKGMYREAIANYQEATRLTGKYTSGQIYLGAAYAHSGEREKALEILKQLETDKESAASSELSVLYAALGEREKAFASLEKAYAARDSQLQFLKIESGFDSLRDDPRFKDLLRRVGLPQ